MQVLRSLWRNKPFTLGVVATLALAIGGNASVFTIVRSVLLRPLPMTRPAELVSITIARRETNQYPLNIPNFCDFQTRNRTLSAMSAYASFNVNLSGESDPERIPGVRVTANYFRMTGINALVGRTLLPEDDTPGRHKVVVLTAGLWRRRYGGDPAIVGRTLRLNGEPYTVLGVLPPEFAFGYNAAELAVPLAPDADSTRNQRGSVSSLRVDARMKPSVGIRAVQADLDSIAAELRRQYPVENGAWIGTRIVPLSDQLVVNARPVLLLLMTAVILVLLIACANIAALMLARAAGRQQELAVRMALGAGRARLLREFAAESCILALAGGVLGMILAQTGVPLLLALSPANLPRANEVHVDAVVVTVVAAIVCGVGVLFAVFLALYASRTNPGIGLRTGSRTGTAGRSQNRARHIFVITELALALVLLAGAGVVLRNFVQLRNISPGFDTTHLLTTRLSLPAARYKTTADIVRFREQLTPAVEALPGVRATGAISILPLSGPVATADYTVVGRPLLAERDRPVTDYRMIDPGYFPAIGARILHGRGFTDADRADSPLVAVVNEALVRQQWPGGTPLGAQLRVLDAGSPRVLEVIGVVSDVRATSLDTAPQPCMFVPIPQVSPAVARFLTNSMFWVVRTSSEPAALAEPLARAIHKIDPDVAAANRVGMEFYLDRALAQQRFTLRLLLVFALSALVLAAQGVYALISHTLAQRTREIGIRLALGAGPAQVGRLVVGYGLSLAVPGLLCGFVGCAIISRLVVSLLYNVKRWDPLTIGAVSFVLALTALVAGFAPARRSMRVDPATALRGD